MSLFTRADRANVQGQAQNEPLENHPASKSPEHYYKGKITKAKIKNSDFRGGDYVLLLIETPQGKLFHNLEFNNDKVVWTSPEGNGVSVADFAKGDLKKIIFTAYQNEIDMPEKLETLPEIVQALETLPVRVHVTHTQSKDGEKTYIRVKFGKVDYEDKVVSSVQAGVSPNDQQSVAEDALPF